MIEFLGISAGVLTGVSFFPQAIRVIRTKDTSSISLATYVAFCIGVVCWIVYGLVMNLPSIYLCNFVTLIPSVVVLRQKIINRKEDQS
ncbi:SemiSWEET family sugar transporter [Lacticaseibacillus hegangensis]|uniref:SemiSWEET family sugar transporter n=1 Tax=Lacticaseibacillus hegangensis TaxID=2486010 RepID=A0ABW4D0S0_9LACO